MLFNQKRKTKTKSRLNHLNELTYVFLVMRLERNFLFHFFTELIFVYRLGPCTNFLKTISLEVMHLGSGSSTAEAVRHYVISNTNPKWCKTKKKKKKGQQKHGNILDIYIFFQRFSILGLFTSRTTSLYRHVLSFRSRV